MKHRTRWLSAAAVAALLCLSFTASAAMVMRMGLADLVGNADKVFRGTVLTKEPGTVAVGGGELDTVVYTLRVDDAIKGHFGSGKQAEIVELTMVGSLKDAGQGDGPQRLMRLDMNPDLQVGGDYVLFTTAPSAAGLSTTVGLDQGLFRVVPNESGRAMAANGLGNRGLFGGPVSYDELKAAINDELN